MLTKEKKQESMALGKMHDSDTGSSAVQVSTLTSRLQQLDAHLKVNRKDKHSRRGLVRLVEQRRKHLSYLERKNPEIYKNIIKTLGLRK